MYIKTNQFYQTSSHTANEMEPIKIAQISKDVDNITLVAKVIDKSPTRTINTRYGPANIAVTTLQDETGEIQFKLWRDQINQVQVGDQIELVGAFSTEFQGVLELNLGRTGKITVLPK